MVCFLKQIASRSMIHLDFDLVLDDGRDVLHVDMVDRPCVRLRHSYLLQYDRQVLLALHPFHPEVYCHSFLRLLHLEIFIGGIRLPFFCVTSLCSLSLSRIWIATMLDHAPAWSPRPSVSDQSC